MPVKKRTRRASTKLSTRFKKNPVGTVRSEFNKLGIIGKSVVVGVSAGAIAPSVASELNRLPIIGKFMRSFTGAGAKLARRLK
jgi:hypothetical protein